MKKALVFFFCLSFFSGCKKPQPSGPDCDDSESLFLHAQFPVGAAIDINALLLDPDYRGIAVKQFNSITPENVFKASFIHPEANRFNWSMPDTLSEFCRIHNKRLHGHVLIWHEQLPAWILNFEGSRQDWEKLMKDHIQSIVRHFKGRVKSWDVVNEAFEEDGTLRNTIWKQKVGDDYIEKAFMFANEADPDVLLFYNDFLLELNANKRKAVLQYFGHLRARGIRIDGLGLQMHISTAYPEREQISEALKEIAGNDYKTHLSEIDISVNPFGKDISPSAELFNEQATILGQLLQSFKAIPSNNQYGMTFWGISDKNSWLRKQKEDYPLLYDDNYKVKPAYCKLKQSL